MSLLIGARRSLLASPLWTPFALGAGLAGFFDPSDLDTLTFNGGNIASWRDKVSGASVSQAVAANQPGYSATGLNGKPATLWGTNDALTMAGVPATWPVGNAYGEIWSLANSLNVGSNTRWLMIYGDAAAGAFREVRRAGADAANSIIQVNTGGGAVGSPIGFLGIHTVGAVFSVASLAAFLDNVSGAAPPPTTLATGTTKTVIGCAYSEVAAGLSQIGPIILTNRPTTTEERLNIQGYMNRNGAM